MSLCILLAPGWPLSPELISAAQACAIKSDQRRQVEGSGQNLSYHCLTCRNLCNRALFIKIRILIVMKLCC